MAETEKETLEWMGDPNRWRQEIAGYYRFMICSCGWYEIQVSHRDWGASLEETQASLFLVGQWRAGESGYFGRECLLADKTFTECIKEAQKDYREHVATGWKKG